MTETAQLAARARLFACLYSGAFDDAVKAAAEYESAGGAIDSDVAWGLAFAHLCKGQYGKARTVLERVIQVEDANPGLWWLLGHIALQGRRADPDALARAAWETGVERVQAHLHGVPPGNLRVAAWLACLFGCLGDAARVHEIVDLVGPDRDGYVLFRLAVAEAELGHTDDAVGLLREAVAHGFRGVEQLRLEERCGLIPLVDDEGYQAVVAELEQGVAALRQSLEDSGIWALLDEASV